jgi:cell division protein FtsL
MQISLSKQTIWSITKYNLLKEVIHILLNIPLRTYGQTFLLVSVFLSALSCIYLKTLQREHVHRLQLSQQYTEQLQQRWNQLEMIHNTWSSPDRIQALAETELGLMMPAAQNRVSISQQN